jgi:hypothetical protein
MGMEPQQHVVRTAMVVEPTLEWEDEDHLVLSPTLQSVERVSLVSLEMGLIARPMFVPATME